jgi:hypothetical protein
MQSQHHKPIKRFSLEGNIHDEAAIGRLKQEYVRLLKSEMILTGYAPRLDIDPDFTIFYNHEKEIFEFQLSLYGTYLGKNKTQWITGIDGTQIVPTHKSKSKESLQDQA